MLSLCGMENESDLNVVVCWQWLARKQQVSDIIQNHEQVTNWTTRESGSIPVRLTFSLFYLLLTYSFGPLCHSFSGHQDFVSGSKAAGA